MVIDAIKNADVCVSWNGDVSPEDAAHMAIICTKGSVIESIKQLPPTRPNLQQTCNQLATDCISRQTAIDIAKNLIVQMNEYHQYNQAINNYCAELVQLPSVQPERKKGKWIEQEKGIHVTSYKCSECGRIVRDDTGYDVSHDYPFCHCGADMRGDQDATNKP